MARVDRLEAAFVRITEVLVSQNERLDGLRTELRGLGETLTDRLDRLGETLTDRLDRLIAITTKERTFGIERLDRVEARLERLERHIGI